MQHGYSRFRRVPGVESSVNNESLHVEVCQWIEYACGVQFETMILDRRVHLGCTWISLLSEELLVSILLVCVKYTSRVIGHATSPRYCLDSPSISGWLEIYCTGSVSGQLRSGEWFPGAINCKLFNISDSGNIPNSFVTLVSGAPEIVKQQGIGIKLQSSGAPQNTDFFYRFRNHNSTENIWWRWVLTANGQILTQRNIQ
jgi:hypothetical protein